MYAITPQLFREPSLPPAGLSSELARYARTEGVDPYVLAWARAQRGRRTAAVRDWVAGLRRPGRFVPAGQH